MAVNPPAPQPQPIIVTPPLPTQPDPIRMYVAVAMFAFGLLLVAASAVVASFHFGDAQPLYTTGGALVAGSGLTMWDRQAA